MALNEGLLKRLIETPGVPGREEKQREIAREELGLSDRRGQHRRPGERDRDEDGEAATRA